MVIAGVGMALVLGPGSPGLSAAEPPPTAAIAGPSSELRRPFEPRGASRRRGGQRAESSGTWWLGTAGIALALAVVGGVSVAARRHLPRAGVGPMRVVGRTSLSPRHTVYLLEVDGRVLIVGAGTQGPPSLLGELTGAADRAEGPGAGTAPVPSPSSLPRVRFDRRVGGDA
jgi:hypothetical protein